MGCCKSKAEPAGTYDAATTPTGVESGKAEAPKQQDIGRSLANSLEFDPKDCTDHRPRSRYFSLLFGGTLGAGVGVRAFVPISAYPRPMR
eukprot:5076513-Amphidinium_carterae.1